MYTHVYIYIYMYKQLLMSHFIVGCPIKYFLPHYTFGRPVINALPSHPQWMKQWTPYLTMMKVKKTRSSVR